MHSPADWTGSSYPSISRRYNINIQGLYLLKAIFSKSFFRFYLLRRHGWKARSLFPAFFPFALLLLRISRIFLIYSKNWSALGSLKSSVRLLVSWFSFHIETASGELALNERKKGHWPSLCVYVCACLLLFCCSGKSIGGMMSTEHHAARHPPMHDFKFGRVKSKCCSVRTRAQ